ncbi:MAG TPA: hypothetical protein VN864_04485 [Thermoplasmata archaeon]|nr:hypothetical protein [Thermoplasmata archaeon]
MSDPPRRWWTTAWLALPVFGYTFALALLVLRQIGPWAVLGAALTALPLVTCLPSRGTLLTWAGPAAALSFGFLIGAPHQFAVGSIGMSVFGGVALASPVAGAAAILRWRHDAALVLPLTFAGLIALLTMRAALDRVAVPGSTATPGKFALAMGQVSWDQLTGVGNLLLGSKSASLPLQPLTDPYFALLTLVAVVGTFLALFLPEPTEGAPHSGDPADVLVPVLVAVVSVAVFELAAARVPAYALLGLSVACLGSVVAIRLLARRKRVGSLRRSGGPSEIRPEAARAAGER